MDESDSTSPPSRTPLGALLTRLGYALAALFLVWLFLGQIGPRLLTEYRAAGKQEQLNRAQPATPSPEPEEASRPPEADPLPDRAGQELLDKRLALLDEKLAALEAKLAAPPSPAPAPAPVMVDSERSRQLEARLEGQQREIESLRETLAQQSQQLAALAAFGQLKEAALRGDPFGSELTRVKAHAPDAKTRTLIAGLSAYASDGLATMEKLQAAFEAQVSKALAATSGNTLKENLTSLIRIRKVGENQTGVDDESVLARAEAGLDRGDLEACLRELAALSPKAAAAFDGWITEAQNALAGRALLGELQMSLLAPAP